MPKTIEELISSLEQYARGDGSLAAGDLELASALQRELGSGEYDEDDPKALAKALKVAEARVARRQPVEEDEDLDEEDEDLEGEDEEDEEGEEPPAATPPLRRRAPVQKSAKAAEAGDEGEDDDIDALRLDTDELAGELDGLSDVVDVGPAIEAIARNSAAIAKSMNALLDLQRKQASRLGALEKSLAARESREPMDLKDAVAEALEKSAAGALAGQFRELQERTDALQEAVDNTVVSKHPRLSKSAGPAASAELISTGRAIEIIKKCVSAGDISEDDALSAFRELRTGDALPVLQRYLPEKLEAHIRSATA